VTTLLGRKRKTCAATKADGSPCTSAVLTPDGLESLLEQGAALIPDAGSFCSFHARSPEDRARMQRRGGQWSPKQEARARAAREQMPDPMPKEFALTSFRLIQMMLGAKLAGVFPAESDFRKQSLGAFLASCMYTLPDDDRARYAYKLVDRDIRNRPDLVETAQEELRAIIEELPEDEQHLAWEIIGAAS
jgi:hypothetical protein